MSSTKEAVFEGRLVSVIEVKGGWSTILDGMSQIKVRNSQLTAPVDGKATVAPKKGAAKPAKVAKSAAKPKADRKVDDSAINDSRLVKPDLTRYVTSDEVKTASGRKAIDIDDSVAAELRGMDLDDAYRAASAATGETQKALKERYGHLNPGMQRMNLGNRIRGARAAEAREEAKAAAAAAKPVKAPKAAAAAL